MVRSVLVVAALSSVAHATPPEAPHLPSLEQIADDALLTLDQLWPDVPADTGLTLEQRITDKVSEAGNHLGYHLDIATRGHASLHVDGRARRARFRFGGSNEHLTVSFDGNVMFADGKAIVKAKVQLALQGHHLEVELPNVDVSRDSYRNEGMTEVNISVLEKRF